VTITAPSTVDTYPEPGLTLADEQPKTLGLLDHTALWGNLGISLLGPVTAVYVVANGMSFLAAFVAIVVGTLIGTIGLGLANMAGARTGMPAMVMLRGLFGTRLSYLPTILNLVQVLGWAVFELVVISTAASQLLPWHVTWPYVVIAGVLTTVMAVWPLGSVRLLRRYALIAEVAVSVSWIPLAADYSRHSRSPRTAFVGSYVGYSVTQIMCYGLGLLAFSTVASADPSQHGMFAALIAVPVGWLAFGVLVVRELDESFANVYSTAVSTQNLRPRADRRWLAVIIGGAAIVLALLIDINAFQNFLLLLGSVFVPMFAVFVVQYFVYSGWKIWDSTQTAPSRLGLLLPWVLGFMAYQLVNPGSIPAWASMWHRVGDGLHFAAPSWVSASLFSFVVAFVVSLPFKPRSVAA
jgi:purine-cytosine permease-like protein